MRCHLDNRFSLVSSNVSSGIAAKVSPIRKCAGLKYVWSLGSFDKKSEIKHCLDLS